MCTQLRPPTVNIFSYRNDCKICPLLSRKAHVILFRIFLMIALFHSIVSEMTAIVSNITLIISKIHFGDVTTLSPYNIRL